MSENNGLFKTGKILTLIGAIWQTFLLSVILLCYIFFSFFGQLVAVTAFFSLGFVWLILCLPFIVLIWVARTKAVSRGSTGWTIYGLIQSILICDICSIIGYIMFLITISVNLDKKSNKDNETTYHQSNSVSEGTPEFTSNQRYYDITPTENSEQKSIYVELNNDNSAQSAKTQGKTQAELEEEIAAIKRKIAELQAEQSQNEYDR